MDGRAAPSDTVIQDSRHWLAQRLHRVRRLRQARQISHRIKQHPRRPDAVIPTRDQRPGTNETSRIELAHANDENDRAMLVEIRTSNAFAPTRSKRRILLESSSWKISLSSHTRARQTARDRSTRSHASNANDRVRPHASLHARRCSREASPPPSRRQGSRLEVVRAARRRRVERRRMNAPDARARMCSRRWCAPPRSWGSYRSSIQRI